MDKKQRGRPRKSSVISQTENSQTSSPLSETDIDNSRFEFFQEPTAGVESNDFNPLNEVVIKRDYSAPDIAVGSVPDIEEPKFFVKDFNQLRNEQNTQLDNAGGQQNSNSQQPYSPSNQAPNGQQSVNNINPAMNELDDKEKRLAAEQLVDAVLDAYDAIKIFSAKLATFDIEKIQQDIQDGVIDANRRIPIDGEGNTVNIIEFFETYNAQVVDAVQPDPKFRKDIRPTMIRIFMRKGWGMTDDQYMYFKFGKDIIGTGAQLFAMHRGMKMIYLRMKEEAATSSRPAPAPRPAPYTSPQPPQGDGDFGGFYEEAPNPTPPPMPPNNYTYEEPKEPETYEAESISDEDLEFEERMAKANQSSEANNEEDDSSVQKMKIDFASPLRDKRPKEYPAPKVEETFEKGREI